MKVACIVAEYNPFHKGHLYHIDETRRSGATHVVAVMSGAFVQRGEPAAFSKFARAKAAVLSGADLVLELPVRYALSSSERFAFGAVSLAKAIGCTDMLSFGCESGGLESLKSTARAVSRDDVRERAKTLAEQGLTYAEALSKAACEFAAGKTGLADTGGVPIERDIPPHAPADMIYAKRASETMPQKQRFIGNSPKVIIDGAVFDGNTSDFVSGKKRFANKNSKPAHESTTLADQDLAYVLRSPNNLLAVDYLRALEGSAIEPLAIKRSGNQHDGAPESGFASASHIRAALKSGELPCEFLPESACEIFKNEISLGRVIDDKNLDGAVLYRLRGMGRDAFRSLPDCGSGLGDRLYSAAQTAGSLAELYCAAKTRRYTMSRVRRAVMCALVGIYGGDFPPAPYARILAIGKGGAELLARIKRLSSLPLSASLNDFIALGGTAKQQALAEIRATDIQALMFRIPAPCAEDHTIKLFKEDNND